MFNGIIKLLLVNAASAIISDLIWQRFVMSESKYHMEQKWYN